MNLLTNETAVKLWCCAEAVEAMLKRGEKPGEDALRLWLKATHEAIEVLEAQERGPTSILSREPDGMGAYYGRKPGDHRLINVWFDRFTHGWRASVAGENIMLGGASGFPSKSSAEAAALAWIERNPPPEAEGAP